MDLLKAIAKDHLVLLVTHEANLVDYYCDTVIELQDGKVVGTKQNTSANGFAARDKNDIYLGELNRREITDESAEIEYYGDIPESPIKLKIINNGGKLYVQIGTEKVQIIDEFSEIKLKEGVYEEKVNKNAASESIDMSKLPPVKGTRFGRLFSTKSSIKSGYAANFKNRKKGKKILRGCMCLFAAVIVFMSAVFGTAFGKIIDARNAYNHNVFYLYTPDAEVSGKLNAAIGDSTTGIDFVSLTGNQSNGDKWVYFRTGSFETFEEYDYESNFKTNAVYLDVSLAKDLKLAEGKKDGLAVNEILISTKVADALLEKSTLGYITEREDLLGLVGGMFTVDGKSPRIAGIVESSEPAIYLTEIALAKYSRGGSAPSFTTLASDFGVEVAPGETILAIKNDRADVTFPSVGETIKIQGREVKVVDIKRVYYEYAKWLEGNGIKKVAEHEYFSDIVKQEQPEIIGDTEAFDDAVANIGFMRYFEYYDYYYAEVDDFFRDLYFFEPNNLELWIYLEKDVEAVKWSYLPEEYYKATVYKERNGRYPTPTEIEKLSDSIPSWDIELKQNYITYEEEFWTGNHYSSFNINTYMLSEEDYIATSKQLGETHPSAMQSTDNDIYYEKSIGVEKGIAVDASSKSIISSEVEVDVMYMSETYYTVIHSNDPEKTQVWLNSEFSDLSAPNRYWSVLTTPDDVFDGIIEQNVDTIIASLITMAVIVALMSLCMYFIMRSSLMNRIKEVGIYRAIGVSKKNLVFKFFIEAVVLTTLTVFIGYLLTSAFLFAVLGMSSIVAEIFYYPLWLAGAVLVILYVISLFFGTLPILSLLRKTPSEILAKYDI